MHKTLSTLILSMGLVLNINAEELIWFSLECNLRNADVIVEAEILDRQGTLRLDKYYKGDFDSGGSIQLSNFAIDSTKTIRSGFPIAVGRKVILFIDLDENLELQPAFLHWTISTLWLEDEKLLGAFQWSNPGDYSLYPFFETEQEFKLKVDNWIFLKNLIFDAQKIETAHDRILYLLELFNWHPFKEDVLIQLSKEESLGMETALEIIWKIFGHKSPSKSDIYPCMLYDIDEDNYFQIAFTLFKKSAGKRYDRSMNKVLTSYMNHITYLDWKVSSLIHEDFILEMTKFLNNNPTENWEDKKTEIHKILHQNKQYLNHLFFKSLVKELKMK